MAACLRAAVIALALGTAIAGTTVPAQGPAGSFLVTNVRVFDGEKVLASTHVVVSGGIIRAVGGDIEAWRHLPSIDGAGGTLLPGLIDAHVHVVGTEDLRQALRFGATTVLDMSAIGVGPRGMRDIRARASAATDLADVRSAGMPATSPSGHGTEYRAPIQTFAPGTEARAFVAKRREEGSDYLKIMLNGVLSARRGMTNLDDAQTRSLVDAAHADGMIAVAHVETVADVEIALAAGVDGLAHTWRQGGPSPGLARRLAERKVFVVPTLSVPDGWIAENRASLLADARFQGALTDPIRQHLSRNFDAINPTPAADPKASLELYFARVRGLREAGARLLVGSDAGRMQPTAFGIGVHREIELLAHAGLSPLEALAAATANVADAFRLFDRGRIAPGLRADMLLVRGDPTTDVLATRDIARVWKAGAEVDRSAR